MNDYDDLDRYDLYSNSYIINYNYNYDPHNVDIIESIDVSLEIFDQFTDDEWREEEEAQRMSIETINLTQQIINGEI